MSNNTQQDTQDVEELQTVEHEVAVSEIAGKLYLLMEKLIKNHNGCIVELVNFTKGSYFVDTRERIIHPVLVDSDYKPEQLVYGIKNFVNTNQYIDDYVKNGIVNSIVFLYIGLIQYVIKQQGTHTIADTIQSLNDLIELETEQIMKYALHGLHLGKDSNNDDNKIIRDIIIQINNAISNNLNNKKFVSKVEPDCGAKLRELGYNFLFDVVGQLPTEQQHNQVLKQTKSTKVEPILNSSVVINTASYGNFGHFRL